MALRDLNELVEERAVVLTAPDGYTLRGIYKRYIPSAMRYEFEIFVGGSTASEGGTTVLFHKETFERYTVVPDPQESYYN